MRRAYICFSLIHAQDIHTHWTGFECTSLNASILQKYYPFLYLFTIFYVIPCRPLSWLYKFVLQTFIHVCPLYSQYSHLFVLLACSSTDLFIFHLWHWHLALSAGSLSALYTLLIWPVQQTKEQPKANNKHKWKNNQDKQEQQNTNIVAEQSLLWKSLSPSLPYPFNFQYSNVA